MRAALGCHDVAVAWSTPFISGKDSLNNEFSYVDAAGRRQTVSIPPSLLISALGQIDDISLAVTMDAKEAGKSGLSRRARREPSWEAAISRSSKASRAETLRRSISRRPRKSSRPFIGPSPSGSCGAATI